MTSRQDGRISLRAILGSIPAVESKRLRTGIPNSFEAINSTELLDQACASDSWTSFRIILHVTLIEALRSVAKQKAQNCIAQGAGTNLSPNSRDCPFPAAFIWIHGDIQDPIRRRRTCEHANAFPRMAALSRLLILPTRLILRFSSVLVNSGADINIQVDHYFYGCALLAAVIGRRPTRSIRSKPVLMSTWLDYGNYGSQSAGFHIFPSKLRRLDDWSIISNVIMWYKQG